MGAPSGRGIGANRHLQRAPMTCSLAGTMRGSPRHRVNGRVTETHHKCCIRDSCVVGTSGCTVLPSNQFDDTEGALGWPSPSRMSPAGPECLAAPCLTC